MMFTSEAKLALVESLDFGPAPDEDGARYRLDWYAHGECHEGLREQHSFDDADDAVTEFLANGWRYDDPEGPQDVEAALLGDVGVVLDRETGAPARVIGYRRPAPGESRLPVAVVFDVEAACISRTATVEQHQERQAAVC